MSSGLTWLRTAGPRIVTTGGEPVLLRGVGLGGWLTMENFFPWMTRTAAVRAKKEAVAADDRGMTTDGMRDVLEPLMTRFTREFPAFGPYPFGARRYAEQLVLNICFAEPLSDEFAASFADASDDELAALGASFAFGGCVRDDRLCQVVARSRTI